MLLILTIIAAQILAEICWGILRVQMLGLRELELFHYFVVKSAFLSFFVLLFISAQLPLTIFGFMFTIFFVINFLVLWMK